MTPKEQFEQFTEVEQKTLKSLYFLGVVRDVEAIIRNRKFNRGDLLNFVELGLVKYDTSERVPMFELSKAGRAFMQEVLAISTTRKY